MNLYQMIFKRRSVRKYKKEAVPEQLQGDIENFFNQLSPLYPDISTRLVIRNNEKGGLSVKGMLKVDAPCYLVFYSEEKEGYLRNAGWLLEQMVLYMTGKGLGTCYLGDTQIGGEDPDGLKQVIVVAFGYPKSLLYRDPATAKRLSLKELCVYKEEPGENVKNILKAVRLAPSALNSQPWRFIVYRDRIYIFACREFLPVFRMRAMRDLGIGIMLSHLSLAAEEMWVGLRLEVEAQMARKTYKSGTYVATAYLKE